MERPRPVPSLYLFFLVSIREKELNILPGVVENGIFTNLVDKVIIGSPSGIKEINKDDIL